ncbi:ComEA family DNA-binding protein [Plantibacter sp. YIM 135249]|uniref:ComEA family DNA-binding protein n=1 Tax=Plantibacter sp. YIM 135249 TaxID=3423918 RepID=UPI003D343E75
MTSTEPRTGLGWTLLRSIWVIPSIVGLGMFTWAGFLYVGIAARRRSWLIASAAWLAAAIAVGWMVTEFESNTLGGLVIIGIWAGGAVHSLLANREWLRRFAPQPAIPVVRENAVHLPPPPALPKQAHARIDLNTASSADFQEHLGVDQAWGDYLVQLRAQRGGYRSVDELLTAAQLPAEVFLEGQDRFIVGELQAPAHPSVIPATPSASPTPTTAPAAAPAPQPAPFPAPGQAGPTP